MLWGIKNGLRELKWKIQRFRRGYADVDVWGLCDWFIETVEPMLRNLQEHSRSYPVEINDNIWEERLGKMADHLHLMSSVNVINEIFDGNVTNHWEEINDIIIENKKKFFEMFVENFYELWD